MRKLKVLNGNIQSRLKSFKRLKSLGYEGGYCTGPYHFNFSANDEERPFYLGSAFQPVGRYTVLEIDGYCHDAYHDPIKGLILALPHNRFLAGWASGKGMISSVKKHVFDSKELAENYANILAKKETYRWLRHQEEI